MYINLKEKGKYKGKYKKKLKKNRFFKKVLKVLKNKSYYKKVLYKKSLGITPLLDELISLGAFIGDHYKRSHPSQANFISGYRNKYNFYNIQLSIQLLTNATRFIKSAMKKKHLKFIFVGNPPGSEEKTASIFAKIKKRFFPNEKWSPGFLSKRPMCSNYILVVYNISQNQAAFYEALHVNIPVVAFVTPSCNIYGVDYPIVLNLKNNKIWYSNFFKALFINDTKLKYSKI